MSDKKGKKDDRKDKKDKRVRKSKADKPTVPAFCPFRLTPNLMPEECADISLVKISTIKRDNGGNVSVDLHSNLSSSSLVSNNARHDPEELHRSALDSRGSNLHKLQILRRYKYGMSPTRKCVKLQTSLESAPEIGDYLSAADAMESQLVISKNGDNEDCMNDDEEDYDGVGLDAGPSITSRASSATLLSGMNREVLSRPMSPKELKENPNAFKPIKRPNGYTKKILFSAAPKGLPVVRKTPNVYNIEVTHPPQESAVFPTRQRGKDATPLYEPKNMKASEKDMQALATQACNKMRDSFAENEDFDSFGVSITSQPLENYSAIPPQDWEATNGMSADSFIKTMGSREKDWVPSVGIKTTTRRPPSLNIPADEPAAPYLVLSKHLRNSYNNAASSQYLSPFRDMNKLGKQRYFDSHAKIPVAVELNNIEPKHNTSKTIRLNTKSTKSFGEPTLVCSGCSRVATLFCRECNLPYCFRCWGAVAHHEYVDASSIAVEQATRGNSKYVLNDNPPIYMNSSGSIATDLSRLHNPNVGTDVTLNSRSTVSRDKHAMLQDNLQNPSKVGLKHDSSLTLSMVSSLHHHSRPSSPVAAEGSISKESLCDTLDDNLASRQHSTASLAATLGTPSKNTPFSCPSDLNLELKAVHMSTDNVPIRETSSRISRNRSINSTKLASVPVTVAGGKETIGSRLQLVNIEGDVPLHAGSNKQGISMNGVSICLSQVHNPPPAAEAQFGVGDACKSTTFKTVVTKKDSRKQVKTIYQEVQPSVYPLPNEIVVGREVVKDFLPALDLVEHRGMSVRTTTA